MNCKKIKKKTKETEREKVKSVNCIVFLWLKRNAIKRGKQIHFSIHKGSVRQRNRRNNIKNSTYVCMCVCSHLIPKQKNI